MKMKLIKDAKQNGISERVGGLDTLRFFAATSVMFAHLLGPILPGYLAQWPILRPISDYSRYVFTGGPAVIVFFVISGFCIHFPYRNRNLPTIPFLIARWSRISIPMVIAYFLAQAVGLKSYNIIEGFILWSVVCELAYYSIYPLLLSISRKTGWPIIFVCALCVSAFLLAALRSDEYGNIHVYGFYLNWLILLPCWLIGVLLAHSYGNDLKSQTYKFSLWLLRFFIVLLASMLTYLTLNTRIGYNITLIPFSFVCFFRLRAELQLFSTRSPNLMFENLGKFSYSIYLFHVVGAALISQIAVHYQMKPFRTSVTIFVTFGLCYVFFLIVEKPAHALARQIFVRLSKAS